LVLARDEADVEAGIATARQFGVPMAERFIAGRELTVGVLGDQALSVVEIPAPPDQALDFGDKYAGDVDEVVVHDLPRALEQELKEIALSAHKVCRLGGYSRSDCRLDEAGKPWLLEINSAPGLTAQSLLPKSAQGAGISYEEMVDSLCRMALAE
jgi:D-alanine-D-alanine ligase